MLEPVDARRRWWGTFFLTVAAAMLIWGQTLLKSHLEGTGVVFLGYWLLCLAFTGLAILTALLDLWIIRRRLRRQQSDLIARAISATEKGAELHRPSEKSKTDDAGKLV